jgi:hypothetical protein
MKISQVLSGIRQSQTEKTAGDQTSTTDKTAAAAPPAADPLAAALAAALEDTTKTASAAPVTTASPVNDVMKIAEELAGIEQAAQLKQASVLGAALADSFVARLGQWQEKAAALVQQPVATQSSFAKTAAENPALLQQAQQVGYAKTAADLQRHAEEQFASGFDDTVKLCHDLGVDQFVKGAAQMDAILDQALKG